MPSWTAPQEATSSSTRPIAECERLRSAKLGISCMIALRTRRQKAGPFLIFGSIEEPRVEQTAKSEEGKAKI
jgi:hypothetical protein